MQIDFEGAWNVKYIDHAKTVLHSSHMMLPMVAVASAKKWQTLSETQQKLLQEIVAKHLEQIILAYEKIDQDYLEQIQTTGVSILKVDRAFFGESIKNWYQVWRTKSPTLKALEQEAAQIKAQTP